MAWQGGLDADVEDDAAPEWMRMFGEEDKAASGEKVRPAAAHNSEDATRALLSQVRERLAGDPARYRRFLEAISVGEVDHAATLAVIKDHVDLVDAFKRCFRDSAGARAAVEEVAQEASSAAKMEHRGSDSRITQLVDLLLSTQDGCAGLRVQLAEHIRERSEQAQRTGASPTRRLVLLRGPHGVDRAAHAQQELRDEIGNGNLVARLAHICSPDDFFAKISDEALQLGGEPEYNFDATRLTANHLGNEARVRLSMDIGIDPLYVDDSNMTFWDMRTAVLLADRFGYDVVVVPPQEITPNWSDVQFLSAQLQAKFGETDGQYYERSVLSAMIEKYQTLPFAEDPRPTIRKAERPEDDHEVDVDASPEDREQAAWLTPTALLCRLDRLLLEGAELKRMNPPFGTKGFGVDGELDGRQVSFREGSDGVCTLTENGTTWWTEEPDQSWTIVELAFLSDLEARSQELPQVLAETLAKNKRGGGMVGLAARRAPGGQKAPVAATRQVSKAAAWTAPAGIVPSSRAERMKARLDGQREGQQQQVVSKDPAAEKKDAFRRMAAQALAQGKESRQPHKEGQKTAVAATPVAAADEDDDMSMAPTADEEISAATFIAAVKTRLTEWGKEELYHEFIVALSGDVDQKAAVRILRGHHDLLRVFKAKFAPRADLHAIKQELAEEESQAPAAGGPRPPSSMPVKAELGGPRPPASGPRPPMGPPGAKRELIAKGEVKGEGVVPRPPMFAPGVKRGIVTVGDESDEDEEENEASILTAVKKGRQECVAQLAKLLFRKERAAQAGVKARLAMVRYATQRAAVPRFPRELCILRGAPGIGKTDYAMQQLSEALDFVPDEAVAVRLTHVCAPDDFYETFAGDKPEYKFDEGKVESYHRRNETRVRYAMEAGIHPLYVDSPNMRLWEMAPFIELADRLGYVVNVVEPHELNEKCEDHHFLAQATETVERTEHNKTVPVAQIAALVQAFEPMQEVSTADGASTDPFKLIREAKRPAGLRRVEPLAKVPPPPRSTSGPNVGGPIPAAAGNRKGGKGGKSIPPPAGRNKRPAQPQQQQGGAGGWQQQQQVGRVQKAARVAAQPQWEGQQYW